MAVCLGGDHSHYRFSSVIYVRILMTFWGGQEVSEDLQLWAETEAGRFSPFQYGVQTWTFDWVASWGGTYVKLMK